MQKLVLIVIVLILALGDTKKVFKKWSHKGKLEEQNIIEEMYFSNKIISENLFIAAKIKGKFRPPSPLLLAKILATEKCKHKANQPEKKILKIKII